MVPAPLGATFCTNEPVELSSDAEKLLHSGAIRDVPAMYTLPVNFAGASLVTLDGYDHNAPAEVISPILIDFFGGHA